MYNPTYDRKNWKTFIRNKKKIFCKKVSFRETARSITAITKGRKVGNRQSLNTPVIEENLSGDQGISKLGQLIEGLKALGIEREYLTPEQRASKLRSTYQRLFNIVTRMDITPEERESILDKIEFTEEEKISIEDLGLSRSTLNKLKKISRGDGVGIWYYGARTPDSLSLPKIRTAGTLSMWSSSDLYGFVALEKKVLKMSRVD